MNFPDSNRINLLSILPSLGRGGAEIQVIGLINGLDNDLFNKSLVSFETNLSLINKIDRENVYFQHISRIDFNLLKVAKRVASLIDQKQIDIVHCSLQIALLVGWLAVRLSKNKPKLVVAIHTTVHRNKKDEIYEKLIYQWMLRACEKIIFVCENQLIHWVNKYSFISKKAYLIYNGVDVCGFDSNLFIYKNREIRAKIGLNSTDIIICNIAGFRIEKGHAILVEAFAEIIKEVPEAILLLVGDGVTKVAIEEKVKALNLSNRVKFLGALDDVRQVLSISSLSIQASTAVETFSIAMLESLSMGVPMVATNIGGTSEAIIPYKTGILVSPNNATLLADAVIKLISQSKEGVYRNSCRQLVLDRFTKNGMINEYKTFFELIVKK